MTRTVDLVRRANLLDRVWAYVLERGFADLSLRPLSQAVGMSPRTLLYYFGAKEAIVTAVIGRIRERQLAMFDRLRQAELSTPTAVCKAAWAYMTAPEVQPMLRLFFEIYALALRDPNRFPGFLERAIEDWLDFLSDLICGESAERERCRVMATIVLAGYRGFLLDYAATGDAERVGRAVDAWSVVLEALVPEKERRDTEQG
jgi:AcrR family transcriptional regulator